MCNTKTRRVEDALKHCTQHNSHESGSISSKILLAEAQLLNEKYEEASKSPHELSNPPFACGADRLPLGARAFSRSRASAVCMQR